MKPFCNLCETRHESYQAHVFASNANASNREGACESVSRLDADVATGVDAGSGGERPKQRWSRDAYNAYQREYMRRRRSKA